MRRRATWIGTEAPRAASPFSIVGAPVIVSSVASLLIQVVIIGLRGFLVPRDERGRPAESGSVGGELVKGSDGPASCSVEAAAQSGVSVHELMVGLLPGVGLSQGLIILILVLLGFVLQFSDASPELLLAVIFFCMP